MQSILTECYCICNSSSGKDYWEVVSVTENVMNTDEMEDNIQMGDKAYVVNHRGYRAFVTIDHNHEMYWYYPPTKYKSDYYRDENAHELLWVIR